MNSPFFRKLIFIHIVVVFIISILSLTGWQFNIEIFKHPVKGMVAMNPLTATAFILCTISFFLFLYSGKHRNFLIIAKLIALSIVVIGVIKLLSITTGIDAGIDTFFYTQKLKKDIIKEIPNTMALNTSFTFILTGLSLFSIAFNDRKRINFSHGLSLITLFISLLSIITGYIYTVDAFYMVASFIPMALQTAICFFLISLSILFIHSNEGFMGHITSKYEGGKIARMLLPMVIVVPVILDVLRLQGERNGLYPHQFGNVLFIVANIIILLLVIWRSAAAINKSSLIAIEEIEQRKINEEELYKSEKRYRTLFEQNLAGVYQSTIKGVILNCNDAFAKMLKYDSPKELLEINAVELYFSSAERNTFINNIIDQKKLYNYEGVLRCKDGSPLYYIENVSLRKDAVSGEESYDGILIDITERKLAEDKLITTYKELQHALTEQILSGQKIEESEKRFRQIVETAQEGIWMIDVNNQTIFVNKKMCEILEYTEEEMMGRTNLSFKDAEEQKIALQQIARRKKGIKETHESNFITKSGRHIYTQVSTNPILGEDGCYISTLAMITDITERKRAEKEIAMLAFSLRSINECVSITDMEDKSLFVNESFKKTYGYSEEELIGKNMLIVRSPNNPPEVVREILPATLQGKWNGELWNKRKDGSEFPIYLSTTLINDKGSKPLGLIGVAKDITGRKQAEEELAIANRKLAVSNEDIERYAYVTSHDLQEPLRMVTSFLQLLQKKYDQQLDDTAQKYINFAVDGAARMKTLILDLLEFSRISSVEQQHTIINLNDVVAKTRQALKAAIDESQATINVHFLPEVCGNESQLLQLFQNLIGNAIKYISNLKPVIEIGYAETRGEWQFYVQDNGIGIDKKFFEKIFIISQRLHTKKEYEGTGIGLAICKKIVQSHGGKIWVESEQEKGSIFYFTISKIQMNNNTDPKDLCPGILENP